MRSRYRLFMAAILLTAAAGVSFALAQDANTAPPPSAPAAAKPAAELPPIPFANPQAPAIAPALTADQSAPTVQPVASPDQSPLAELKPIPTASKRVVKKTHPKPAAERAIPVTDSFKTAAPVASVAVVEPVGNTPPADPTSNTTHPAAIAPKPPPEGAKPAAVEPSSEATGSERRMGLGGWTLFGIAVVVLFGGITVLRRRRALAQRQPSIVDFTPVSPELDPVLVPRP
jgi:cytoskeletal protein RodZ